MDFTTGWYSGKVINYDSQAQPALITFEANQFQIHVRDFIQHPPSGLGP